MKTKYLNQFKLKFIVIMVAIITDWPIIKIPIEIGWLVPIIKTENIINRKKMIFLKINISIFMKLSKFRN